MGDGASHQHARRRRETCQNVVQARQRFGEALSGHALMSMKRLDCGLGLEAARCCK
jgi:hypothetical protein